MILFTVFLSMCFRPLVVSEAIYGVEINPSEEWWNENYFLQFNSLSGKTFYIDRIDGTIHRKNEQTFGGFFGPYPPPPPPAPSRLPGTPPTKDEISPFISFVSIDLKIYDIYFENNVPKIEESKFTYNTKYNLIRHRLDSFVGPNKKIYKFIYNKGNGSNIVISEKSEGNMQNFQIITFGPYEQWQHTYDFSENGELVTDHSVSRIKILPNRSILLPEVEPNSFEEKGFIKLFMKLNTPSGKKYQLTSQLNIVQIRNDNDEKSTDDPFVTFTEPNRRTYKIYFRNDAPFVVEEKYDENYFGIQRLYSFVGPNGIMYRIDHKTEENNEVPVLVPNQGESSDLQITAVIPNKFYTKYIKYVFSNNGDQLFDRVDTIDWTPLNEQRSLPIDEVDADSELIAFPFLSFYTPSGKNYHIITNETNANIVVEKCTNTTQPAYISFFQTSGRKYHIYFSTGDHPYIEEEATLVAMKESLKFLFLSFVTPDRKKYSIQWTLENGTERPNILLPSQAKDPIDESPEDGLSIKIQDSYGGQFIYRFSWNGDKLIEVERAPPKGYVDQKVLQSLIGK